MTLSRRDLIATGAIVGAVAASGLSACTPADIPNIDLPGKFFAAISMGRLAQARQWLSPAISLSLVSTAGSQRFAGPQDVVEAMNRMFSDEGFRMIGDKDDDHLGGMYWREMGPWQCSDMLKGGAVNLNNGCSSDVLETNVFNVFVDTDFPAKLIKTILMLQNRNLIAQLSFDLIRMRKRLL